MSYNDERKSADPKQTGNPRPHPAENEGEPDWLDALNSFLDRALKADIDTGC